MRGSSHSISYEVSRYRGGKWELDSTFDDRELALEAAHRLRESGRYLGARVIKEWYDENTGLFKNQVIFKDVETQKPRREEVPPRNKRPPEGVKQERPPPPPRRSRLQEPFYLLLIFTGILLLGIAAIIGLRELATLL